MLLLWCPSCPIGERARAELCAASPGYYLTLLFLPYVALSLTPALLDLTAVLLRRFRASEGKDAR